MQWTEEKGRGFSDKKTTYLPVSNKKGQSVAAQEDDADSILNTVRELIKIRKNYSALNADSKQKFIETGYPAVYERTDGKQTITVYINPSDKEIKRKISYTEIIKLHNAEISGDTITLENQSFAILLK